MLIIFAIKLIIDVFYLPSYKWAVSSLNSNLSYLWQGPVYNLEKKNQKADVRFQAYFVLNIEICFSWIKHANGYKCLLHEDIKIKTFTKTL